MASTGLASINEILERRPSKEERLSSFKPGSIRRVRLKNFLTYANVEFFPGPRLNVVIGPNGTGKSTILCAICLGLGGQPSLLGRADDAREFIMHEKDKAFIDIELSPSFDDGKLHTISRLIDRSKGSERGRGQAASTYFINGEQVQLKAVKHLVSNTYQISVDNLCTFLPQDRVGSFSGFDAQMLLCETEKALSRSEHVHTTHMQLIQLENEIRTWDTNVGNIEEKLKTLEAENQHLEREKQLMEERESHKKQMKLLEQKRAWLRFDEARDRCVKLKEDKQRLMKELKEARANLRPLERRLGSVSSKLERIAGRCKSVEKASDKAKKEYEKYFRKSETFQDEIENEMVSLREIDALQRRAERQVDAQRQKVDELEAQMADYPPMADIDAEYTKAQNEIRALKSTLHTAKQEYGHINDQLKELQEQVRLSELKLEKMNDDRARRRDRIFRMHPTLQKTYEWLEQNRKMFRRPVWGPIVCEVTTVSADASAQLEQHVQNAIHKAYVVECREDYNLLYRELREKLGLAVNIQTVEGGKLEPIRRWYSDEKMDILKRDHGVLGYLDEAFSAPDPILQALRTSSRVDTVLVGSNATQESLDRKGLLDYLSQREDDKPGILPVCIFSSHLGKLYKYTQQPSRYSGKPSLRVDEINRARMLAPGVDPEQKVSLERSLGKIKVNIHDLKPEAEQKSAVVDDLTTKGQKIQQRLKDAKAAKTELKNFQMKVDSAKRRLTEFEEAAAKDNVAEKDQRLEKLRLHISNSITALNTAATHYTDMGKTTYTLAGVKMTEDGLSEAARKLKDDLDEKKSRTAERQTQVEEATAAFERARELLRELKNKADKIAPMKDSDGNELPLKAQLLELPETLEEVEEALEEATARVNAIADNPEVLRRYEQRKKDVEQTRSELENLNEAKDAKLQQLKSMKEPWEATLTNTVRDVNDLFGVYMKELGCAGEVHLAKGKPDQEGEEELGNFKNWGIEIRVKFREKSKLQVLSAQVQSGGERSVSTIMYLMALQDLMVSPFRCVDEINQGLDERNERLVFKRIVLNSTRPANANNNHSGQYFLITPKLLPNLTDMEREEVTILCIFNGSYNFKFYSDWNVDQILQNRKRRLIASQPDDEGGDAVEESAKEEDNSRGSSKKRTRRK